LASQKVSPESVPGAVTVDTAEAKRLFDQGVTFVDVRSNADWQAGRIPAAHHLELKSVYDEQSLSQIVSRSQPVVIYCNSTGCMRSSKACQQAVEWGFSRVYYYRLGYPDWKANSFAIE
jgi:rhodanese-related sulfurtransferase